MATFLMFGKFTSGAEGKISAERTKLDPTGPNSGVSRSSLPSSIIELESCACHLSCLFDPEGLSCLAALGGTG